MLNFLEISAWFENEWVVLDRKQQVVDHGKDLEALWEKHEGETGKLTFYFASTALVTTLAFAFTRFLSA